MMVYNGKSQPKMDDLGVPPFMETPICVFFVFSQVVLQQGDLLGIMQHVLHKHPGAKQQSAGAPKISPQKLYGDCPIFKRGESWQWNNHSFVPS